MKRSFLLSLAWLAISALAAFDAALLSALQQVNTAPLIVQKVRASTVEFGSNAMESLKIIQPRDSSVPYKYLGAFHRVVGGGSSVGLAGSQDLKTWNVLNSRIDPYYGYYPDLWRLADGSYLYIFAVKIPGNEHFRLNHFPSYAKMVAAQADRQFDFENTVSTTVCAEGSPYFRKVTYNKSVDDSVIEIGFHYCQETSDPQTFIVPDSAARGILTNFRLWRAVDYTDLNKALHTAGSVAYGPATTFEYNSNTYTLVEGRTSTEYNDVGTRHLWIYNDGDKTAQRLAVKTPGGSYSVGIPKISIHYNAAGTADGIIGTYQLYTSSMAECGGKCPGTNEGGTFLFQQNLSGTLADNSAVSLPFSFRFTPLTTLCGSTNACQGVFLAGIGRDLAAGAGTTTDVSTITAFAHSGEQRIFAYGPYVTTLPATLLTARFRLMIDNAGASYNGDVVGYVDVNDATLDRVISKSNLYQSYNSYGLSLDVNLVFTPPAAGHKMEFRVATLDTATIRVYGVNIYAFPLAILKCPGDLAPDPNVARSTGTSCISKTPTVKGFIYANGPRFSDLPGDYLNAGVSLRVPDTIPRGVEQYKYIAVAELHAFNARTSATKVISGKYIFPYQYGNLMNFTDIRFGFQTTQISGDGWSWEVRVNKTGNYTVEIRDVRYYLF